MEGGLGEGRVALGGRAKGTEGRGVEGGVGGKEAHAEVD